MADEHLTIPNSHFPFTGIRTISTLASVNAGQGTHQRIGFVFCSSQALTSAWQEYNESAYLGDRLSRQVPSEVFRLGRTRVFFRAGQISTLQKILNETGPEKGPWIFERLKEALASRQKAKAAAEEAKVRNTLCFGCGSFTSLPEYTSMPLSSSVRESRNFLELLPTSAICFTTQETMNTPVTGSSIFTTLSHLSPSFQPFNYYHKGGGGFRRNCGTCGARRNHSGHRSGSG